MQDPTPNEDRPSPALRPRTVTPPPGDPPDPVGSARAADRASDRLSTLAHELNNLLDGTIRYVALARRNLRGGRELSASGDQEIARQLGVAQSALDRMATLVRSVMSPSAGSLAERISEPRPLIDAVMHARDVVRPLADERRIAIDIDFSPRLLLTPAGPIYAVIANALRNAIEAVEHSGHVRVIAHLVEPTDIRPNSQAAVDADVLIEVIDDGPGPPADAGERVFDIGFTTKSTGLGVGLALSREIVRELGGDLTLERHDPSANRLRPGARLTIRYPLPRLNAWSEG